MGTSARALSAARSRSPIEVDLLTFKSIGNLFVLVIMLGLLFPTDAFAYLDPGTGSLFVQGTIATLAAAGYALRLYWTRITFWFRGVTPAETDTRGPHGRV